MEEHQALSECENYVRVLSFPIHSYHYMIPFRAWTFGGIAVRICQELGLHKEETLKTPILSSDGTIDYVAMALRRRIFWSCLCIDK